MRLSELNLKGIEIVRDAEFLSIGGPAESKAKCLVKASDPKEVDLAAQSRTVSCILTKKELLSTVPANFGIAVTENPDRGIIDIHNNLASKPSFYPGDFENEISDRAEIHHTAVIGKSGVKIGDGCRIGPRAVILGRTVLEKNVFIGAGSVIGCDPGLTYGKGDQQIRALCAGGVVIRKNAEVHSNSSICRAVFGGDTVIDEETKVDNLVSISQNVRVGKRSYLVASSTIGPDATIGDDVWVGPNAVISGGLIIENDVYITLGSIVMENVRSGSMVTGNSIIDRKKFLEFERKR